MMNDQNGRRIALKAHIAQSINNILSTRIGTRIMREDYGSLLPELIDMPVSPILILQVQAAIIAALAQWEPRVEVIKVIVAGNGQSRFNIAIDTRIKQSNTLATFNYQA